MFIFLDESGDLGFDLSKPKTSRFFVITLLVCHTQMAQDGFRVAVKRTIKNKLNHAKSTSRQVKELKGSQTTQQIKQYFSRQLPDDGWDIYSVTLNKVRVEDHLKTKIGKKKLYNFMARVILEKVKFSEDIPTVSLIVDRCKNREEIKDFNEYLQNHLYALLPLNTRLNIDHLASDESAGLQAVDLFCWGVARKYEHLDRQWYDCFKQNIRFETVYLK